MARTFSRGRPRLFQIAINPAPDFRKSLSEDDHFFVLVLVTHFAPTLVIAVLFASPSVTPCGLEMAVRGGADPDVSIGRWNGEAVQPQNSSFVADLFSFRIEINELLAATLPGVARTFVTHITQPSLLGGRLRIGHNFDLTDFLSFQAKLAGGDGHATNTSDGPVKDASRCQ